MPTVCALALMLALVPVTLRIADASTGAPIADLEPYLGASAHLIAISPDLTEAVHEHPQPGGRGPEITFRPLFPRAGNAPHAIGVD